MSDPAVPNDLHGPAIRAFFNLAAAWQLTEQERYSLLGEPDTTDYETWRLGLPERVTPEVVYRVSYMLGIYRALHTIFPDAGQADGWLKRPNKDKMFGGRSALDVMIADGPAGMMRVRDYLDTAAEAQG
ncbi:MULTISPECIES: MbcA/ParS/Xre antitoxin family protein [Stenotrophomonas]|jgi:uncharacterized protein (DUF2384 family)|uniref:MbcA/ParS/Xre antitoxin family protein n=1 Tax=Stenotrophomonas TaxID=40323 RepID=UPI00066CE8E1|nr:MULTISPECIES: MbcA/ParS/Xre antitoxin family protein [Stenotrophomonas]HEJ4267109.1 DUF2384 domain-containing protein [Pseudomonas aeruginosa]MBA0354950.1 DUF2384 domain-containing protein [Stenotrophomonas maltophilia]MBH1694536.1 DUF2384 domain-containing protein [Stenotrophomonas maltophilia]MDH0551881.1 MbcA/ParS/Xre antitoxin family protein [Stenotrophomonas sp. GD04006]MDT3491752.1 MbcA/ParS/Xre antitoxin family protein [Stenotrophomonas maltophilia group sp. msm4]